MYLMEETLLVPGPCICEILKHTISSALLIGVGYCTFHLPPDMTSFITVPHLYLDESTLPGTRYPHLLGSLKHLEYNIFPLFDDSTQIYLTLSLSFILLSAFPITRIWFLVRSISLLNHQNIISSSSYHLNSACQIIKTSTYYLPTFWWWQTSSSPYRHDQVLVR